MSTSGVSEEKAIAPEPRPKWNPEFFRLPVHASIEWEMKVCMDGIESGVVIGPPGVGKSYSVKRLIERIEAEETSRALDPQGGTPIREIMYYETSIAAGKMTALTDLYGQLTAEPLPSRGRQAASPQFVISLIASKLRSQQVHLVCVDEAQKINAENLNLLRQIPDAAAEIGHPMGFLFIGQEELRDSLVRIRQLGQRIATEITYPLVDRKTLAPHLHEFHPDLAALRGSMSNKGWSKLEQDIFTPVGGKFRRLHTLILNADALARRLGRPIDEKMLRAAIAKLAPED
jgi:type II secretory pathway predicted ATPase ExeA